ncbi:hypothetical protein FY534_12555 [Alicyclobacillus sp. TC]|uniref:hypothetical protein n=1 Tax=Alicyclobacillus sp. TC TaxID=2606450 RepID=UPI0019326134|nr:hypothetical protein [Alicyclobacillus sp. TC]QRF24363.1 hypothetical protein FY534_12555 [Alicyclobacillus sp. TC]
MLNNGSAEKNDVLIELNKVTPIPVHAPLQRAKVKGWVNVVFWGLRIYILAMVVLVIIGFARGTL